MYLAFFLHVLIFINTDPTLVFGWRDVGTLTVTPRFYPGFYGEGWIGGSHVGGELDLFTRGRADLW